VLLVLGQHELDVILVELIIDAIEDLSAPTGRQFTVLVVDFAAVALGLVGLVRLLICVRYQ
jgi:hypothetical protein